MIERRNATVDALRLMAFRTLLVFLLAIIVCSPVSEGEPPTGGCTAGAIR